MEDKLKAAIMAYAETQSKVLDRVFDNIRRTGSPSSADVAFCLPDDVIAGLPQDKQYAALLRKVQFLGYAMWKSACYRQVREHMAFETERTQLIERFPSLERRFQRGIREGYSTPAPVIGAGASPDDIAATVTENGSTLLLLPSSPGCNETGTAGEPSGRRS